MNPRDVKLKLATQQSQKQDKRERYRAVLCAADGSRTTGSVWADEMSKRVYFQFFGSGGVGRARCEKIVPQLGLGVYVGKTDDGLEWQVLEDDPFLRQTATDSRNYQATAPADLQPGGRLFMWLYPKAISPLATYPASTGLTVNVVAGDYPYGGTRKTFAGQNSVDLSASQPASGNHRYVGLYLDAANTLQTVDGTAVAVAADPVEPVWPAGAFRLSVVRIANPQTSIVFGHDDSTANDILDRRMVWSDEQAGGGGWPFAKVLTVSATDPDADYTTIAAAITAAAAGDIILIDAGTYTETLTVDKAITLVGLDPTNTIITSASSATITITAAGAAFRNLTLLNTAGGGTDSTVVQTNVNNWVIENCILTKTGAADDAACVLPYGGTGWKIINSELTTSGATKNYAIWNNTAATSGEIRGGKLSGTTWDIFGDQAGSTITLVKPVLVNNLISFSGTITGDYLDSSGNIRQALANDIYPDNDTWGVWDRHINFGRVPDEHWHQGADQLAWTGWAAYTGFATPGTITRTQSKLTTSHNASARFFYYRSFINAQTTILAAVGVALNSEIGLMVDDGVNNADGAGANNFHRFFIEWATATANANFAVEHRAGGGAVTKITYMSLPPQDIKGVVINYGGGTRWTNWNVTVSIIGTSGQIIAVATVTGLTWTPARHGLYGRTATTAARPLSWDWFEEA